MPQLDDIYTRTHTHAHTPACHNLFIMLPIQHHDVHNSFQESGLIIVDFAYGNIFNGSLHYAHLYRKHEYSTTTIDSGVTQRESNRF